MQRPARLQPLRCAAPRPPGCRQKGRSRQRRQLFAAGGERSGLRLMNSVEYVTGVSPYELPVINNYIIPAPPAPPQTGDKSGNVGRSGVPRARQLRPITAPNLEQLLTKNSGGFPKSSLRSNALVTMGFLGKSVRLSYDDTDYRDEIKVYQQHCGGENLCVYKGKLLEGETFQFVSRRHHGFPFSLTFFLNGMQVERLSCCCEYKHQKRSRTGGRRGYFRFLSVEGASPCYRCIVAMALDKKPSPPKREMQDHEETHVGSRGDGGCSEPSKTSAEPSKTSAEPSKTSVKPSKTSAEQNPGKVSVLVILPGHEASVESIEDEIETGQEYRKEEKKKLPDCESEDSQEHTGKNEYDEDFEADEEVNEEGQTGDQMNSMSKSSSDDKNRNLGYEKESTNSSQKARQAYDSERDESDGYSDSDSEDDKPGELNKGNTAVCEKVAAARQIQSFYRKYKIQQKFKSGGRLAQSLSSISSQYSSDSDSHAETMKDDVEDTEEYNIKWASDNVAHVQHGDKSRENNLLRMEENRETFALEKEGIDEEEKAKPEDPTEDTGIFHDDIMATQRRSPEANGELRPAGSVQGHTEEDGARNGGGGRDGGDKSVEVPLESRALAAQGSAEDSAGVFEDCKPVQEERENGNDHHVNSNPERCDSGADEEEENVTSTERDAGEAPDGAFLAEGTRTLDEQKEAGQVVQEGQVAGDRGALEKDGVAEAGDAGAEGTAEPAQAGHALPGGGTAAALRAQGQLAVHQPQQGPAAGDPQGQGPRKGTDSGAEAAAGERDVPVGGTESEAARGEQALRGREPAAGRAASGGEEEDGDVSGGEEAAEEQEAQEGAEEAVGPTGSPVKEELREMVSEEEEAVEEGGFAEKAVVVGAVSEGEEVVEDADMAEERIAGVVGPEEEQAVEETISEGEEAVEEAVSEGEQAVEEAGLEGEQAVEEAGLEEEQAVEEAVLEEEQAVEEAGLEEEQAVGEAVLEEEQAVGEAVLEEEQAVGEAVSEEEQAVEEAVSEGEEAVEEAVSGGEEDVEKPAALLETLEDTNICRGEATPGEDSIKPREFSQLEAAGEEWLETGEAAAGAPETGRESRADGSSVLRAGDPEGVAVQPSKGPLLQIAPGLEAPVDAGGDPRSEGSAQLEENTTVEEEEGSAEAPWSGNPTPGSTAGSAAEDKPDPGGGAMGGSAETAGAEDVVNPEAAVEPSLQPQDGEDTLL